MENDVQIGEIAHELKRRPLSLFLGAGIGADSGLPTWAELFNHFRDELGIENDADISYPQLAQYYENERGGALQASISQYIGVMVKPSKLLEAAIDLGPTDIWTLAYDQVIERTLDSMGRNYNVVHNESNLTSIFPQDRVTIYKIGGELSSLSESLITTESFEQFEEKHTLIEAFLKKELVTNTFLFLGYSFKDGIAQKALRTIARVLGQTANVHYSIMKRDETNPVAQRLFLKDLEKRYRVRTILVNDYSDIPNILRDIREATLRNRIFISGSLWSPQKVGEKSAYDTCKAIATTAVSNDWTIVSGLGYNIGYYVMSSVSEYCLKRGLNTANHLIVDAGPYDMPKEDVTKWRIRLIKDCSAVIFVYGQAVNSEGSPVISKGVMEEYQIARNLNRGVIPIGSTGYAAKRILSYVEQSPDSFPYLEPQRMLGALNSVSDPESLSRLVSYLLSNIRNYYNR